MAADSPTIWARLDLDISPFAVGQLLVSIDGLEVGRSAALVGDWDGIICNVRDA